MIIKKITELYFLKNDIYVLEANNNTIFINNNDQGMLLFDSSLNKKKEVPILLDAPIYFLYVEYSNKALILYLPDSHKMIFTDLVNGSEYTIMLPKSFYEEILLPNYYWNNDILIFTTSHDKFYRLNLVTKTLFSISYDMVKNLCTDFFDFWSVYKKYNPITLYPKEKTFIFQENDYAISFFDYQSNKKAIMKITNNEWHDIEYHSGIFIIIYEQKIEIVFGEYEKTLKPRKNFIFLKAKFVKDNHFVVLSSNSSNPQESFLEIYNIIDN